MGIDFSARLIVGVPFNYIFTKEKATKTKYHPDTGKPYEMPVDKWLRCGVPFEDDKENPARYPDSYLPKGLAGFCECSEQPVSFIGMLLAEASGSEHCVVLTDQIASATEQAKALFKEVGYEGELSVYLIGYVSV